MINRITNLIGGKLLFKDCFHKALAVTLVMVAGVCGTALASSVNIGVSSAEKNVIADIVVRGIVKDTTGAPLPGAGIKVKGLSTSAAADVNGAFTIRVPDQNAVLVITYVGYDTQEITVGTKTNLDIKLKETVGAN